MPQVFLAVVAPTYSGVILKSLSQIYEMIPLNLAKVTIVRAEEKPGRKDNNDCSMKGQELIFIAEIPKITINNFTLII